MSDAKVGFDFQMDSFVSVMAERGTDPDTLICRALELFKDRLRSGEAEVSFLKIYEYKEGGGV